MNISLNSNVSCTDGAGGRLVCLIIDPATRQLSHIVVDEKTSPFLQRLVPFELVAAATPTGIQLNCTQPQLAALRPFFEVEHLREGTLHAVYEAEAFWRWPQANNEALPVPVELETLPAQAIKIHRNSRVKATDGRAGKVAGFLTRRTTKEMAALIIQQKSWWKTKQVAVPVAQVDHFEPDAVFLNLTKKTLQKTAVVQFQQHYS